MYQEARKKHSIEGYPVSKDGKVYPLELTSNVVKEFPTRDNVVVLSVGGNDGRVCLPLLSDLSKNYKDVIEKMLQRGFKENYVNIIESFLKITNKVIVVLVYKPYKMLVPCCAGQLHKVYDFFMEFYREICKKYKLPLIDLSITFDYNDPTHYGEGEGDSPIEPSNKSSQFIADLVTNVIDDFKFGVDEAKIYYGCEQIVNGKIN